MTDHEKSPPPMTDDIKQIATHMRGVLDKFVENCPKMQQSTRGFCIAASKALKIILNQSGYDVKKVRGRFEGQGHAWVEMPDKIVDITQDQFGNFPRVFVGDVTDKRYVEVAGDDEFNKNMGAAGDDKVWTYFDCDGEERTLDTTDSVVHKLLDLYAKTYCNSDS